MEIQIRRKGKRRRRIAPHRHKAAFKIGRNGTHLRGNLKLPKQTKNNELRPAICCSCWKRKITDVVDEVLVLNRSCPFLLLLPHVLHGIEAPGRKCNRGSRRRSNSPRIAALKRVGRCTACEGHRAASRVHVRRKSTTTLVPSSDAAAGRARRRRPAALALDRRSSRARARRTGERGRIAGARSARWSADAGGRPRQTARRIAGPIACETCGSRTRHAHALNASHQVERRATNSERTRENSHPKKKNILYIFL